MQAFESFDRGRAFDWGQTSDDYARFRPGYPAGFFKRLTALGIGHSGQKLLDLGTGTGNLAREFARLGCRVTGVDVSANQIAAARDLADEQGLVVDWLVAAAEQTGLPAASFDVVTASQCWYYFDVERIKAEVRRLLKKNGRLMTCHLNWLPREDEIARRMEALVLKHNPDWSTGDWPGLVPPIPDWAVDDFELTAMFFYDEPIPFTAESWRGRIRACRAVGASLLPEQVQAFDAEHAAMLREFAGESFTVLHRIDAHILRLR